jgi:GT2 family glycosyltransferase
MRPAVDVVVPFVGSDQELTSLCHYLETLDLADSDSVTVVDNRPTGDGGETIRGRVRVLSAPAVQSSYYARNCGARGGQSAWLLFVDDDVRVPSDLLHRYFEPPPGHKTAVLGGGIRNEAVASGRQQTTAARYSGLSELMAQGETVNRGPFGYAMTANCAIRRSAFEGVDGFIENIRSGGDADICFRLRASGWEMEARDEAAVTHANRSTVTQLARQAARHGSGAAWLEARYPGFTSAGSVPGQSTTLAARAARSSRRLLHAGAELIRGNPDRAIVTVIDIVRSVAFRYGGRLPNEVNASGSQRASAR